MKKVISLIMVIALALSMCTLPVNAAKASKVWDGSVDTSWYTGKKTSYNISTPSQLAGLAKLVNNGNSMEGVMINLTADLVMNDTSDWTSWNQKTPKNTFTPIGLSGNPAKGYTAFAGVFNGNGHTIKGLYVYNGYVAGLFGYLYGGVVSEVIIEESVIASYDNGKSKGNYAGGIAGIAEGAVINKCEYNGSVWAIGPDDRANGDREAYVGGIVGSIHSENASFAALGAVFAATGVWINPAILADGNGGIIKNSGIMNCISSGDVHIYTGAIGYFGGIAGWGNNGDIRNCVAWNDWEYKAGKKVFGKYRGKIYGGMICGGASNCSVSNCAYWKDEGKLNAIGEDWKNSVVPVNRDAAGYTAGQMRSAEFAKKYGNEYTYTNGDMRIYLSCDKRSPSGGSSLGASVSAVSLSKSNGKITIKWGKTANASGYRVCYLKSDGKYAVLTNTTGTSTTLKLKSGTKYTMMIQAKLKDGTYKTITNGKFSFTA